MQTSISRSQTTWARRKEPCASLSEWWCMHASERRWEWRRTSWYWESDQPGGLITLLVAKSFGALRMVIMDIDESRLLVAKKLGSDECVKMSFRDEDMDAEVEEIYRRMGMGSDVDVMVDCVGFNKTMSTREEGVPGGDGAQRDEAAHPWCQSGHCRHVPIQEHVIGSGKIDKKPLITYRFGFS